MVLWRCGHSFVIPIVCALGGCAGNPLGLEVLLKNSAGWEQQGEKIGPYTLQVVKKAAAIPTRIYIEGDGRAYITAYEPSGDPTPSEFSILELALADNSQGVAYVGRPCQWVRTPVCKDKKIWTTGRFSEDKVALMVTALERISGGQPVEVIGYSGGAFFALQAAARLPNVTRVVTVAGNVDPAYVNEIHGAAAIEVADFPASYGRLKEVPQLHVVGGKDKIISRQVAEHLVAKVGAEKAEIRVQESAAHGGPWVINW